MKLDETVSRNVNEFPKSLLWPMQLCNRMSGLIQINRLDRFALTLKSNESMNCRFVSFELCVLNSFFFVFISFIPPLFSFNHMNVCRVL